MAEFLSEEDAGFGRPTRLPRSTQGPADFPKVTQEEQHSRDVFAQMLDREATNFLAGGPTKMPSVREVIPDAKTSVASAASGFLSEEEAGFGKASTVRDTPADLVASTLKNMATVGGEAGALLDFFMAIPGFLYGYVGNLAATAGTAAAGAPREEAWQAGREKAKQMSESFLWGALDNPVKKVLDYFGAGKAYEETYTVAGLEKFGSAVQNAAKWVNTQSGGSIPPEAFETFVDSLMVGAGPIVKQGWQKWKRAHPTPKPVEPEAPITLVEAIVRVPVQQQINNLLAIRTPAEQAKINAARRKEVKETFARGPSEEPLPIELEMEGRRTYPTIEESVFKAEERLQREAETGKPEAFQNGTIDDGGTAYEIGSAAKKEGVSPGDILRILKKPGFERSAEDLIKLRSAAGTAAAIGGVTALAATDPDWAKDIGLAGGAALAGGVGMVFGKRGMPHPELVERLTEPIASGWLARAHGLVDRQILDEAAGRAPTAARDVTLGELEAKASWANRAVSKWLQKPTNAAADVEIPFGETTKPLGEVMDLAIQHESAAQYQLHPMSTPDWVKGAPADEPIWHMSNRPGQPSGTTLARVAVDSFLQHAGDYAARIPIDRLKNYDIPRLLRETAAWDKEMAKKAAKEKEGLLAGQLEVMKTMPVHKAYPDGFKWVQLTRPGEFAKEATIMGNSVRQYEPQAGGYNTDFGPGIGRAHPDWIPESEYGLPAGMEMSGSPGYGLGGWEAIKSGGAKVYSLRDSKGESHVTVEVNPIGGQSILGEGIGSKMQRKYQSITPDITQIRGKGNRAPAPQYLPYVQDFVKSGKWGEVGNLENTGLKPTQYGYLTPEEIKARGLEAQGDNAGGLIYTDPRQRGSIDQKLVMGLGAIGLGGLLGSYLNDDPLDGAILGGLAGLALSLPGAGRRLKDVGKGADYVAGMMSTRLLNKDPAMHKLVLDTDRHTMQRTRAILDRAVDWMRVSANLSKDKKIALDRAIWHDNPEAIAAINKGNPELVSGWREVRNIIRELGESARALGRFQDIVENHFPRRVKDYPGLKDSLDQPIRTRLDRAIEDAERVAVRQGRGGLSAAERDTIINRELRNLYRPIGGQPGYAKARTIPEVTPQLEKFYFSPQEALYITVREIVRDLELAKMFGRDLVQTEKKGRQYINVEMSIGNLVGRLRDEGRIKPEDMKEVESLFRSRYGPGEQAPSKLIQELKSIGYATTIGSVPSTITQLGDPLLTVYAHGPRATMTATARILAGKRRISVEDFGLANHIAEEIAAGAGVPYSLRATQRAYVAGGAIAGALAGAAIGEDLWSASVGAVAGAYISLVGVVGAAQTLNKIFRQTGFQMIDRFGKEVQLNATLDKYERWSHTEKGRAKIREKYGRSFGKDGIDNLIVQLQNLGREQGAISEDIRSLAFMELSRFQPITKWELPQAYADMPNGRPIWMLKTFMMKQADVIRRDAYNEIKRGATTPGERYRIAIGLRNLAAFAFVLGLSGALPSVIKDWIAGRDVDLSAEDVFENMLKTFGFSRYVLDKMEKGEVILAPVGAFMPPAQVMQRIITADPKAVKHIPVIGELYYSWELGGREEAEIRAAKEAKSQGIEVELSPGAQAFREHKRDLARMKREMRGP